LVGATSKHNSEKFEDCRTPTLLNHHDTAIVDSGCTGHFLLINTPCHNNTKSVNPFRVRLPNSDAMDSTHTASLEIPELSEAASVAYVFPSMAKNSLLSVGKLCNEGYYVTLKIEGVTIFNHEGKTILKGQIPISGANNVYELRNTGAVVNYFNKEMLSPTKSALIKAVKQSHLTTWPGITADAINKHLKMTPATAMGHMNQKKAKHPFNQQGNAGNI
jgi:hypothetical protein